MTFVTKTDARHQKMNQASNQPHYLSHVDEPIGSYQKYRDNDFRPMKGGRNLQNLFDDSDVKDYYWFNIARKFLGKY